VRAPLQSSLPIVEGRSRPYEGIAVGVEFKPHGAQNRKGAMQPRAPKKNTTCCGSGSANALWGSRVIDLTVTANGRTDPAVAARQ
jgi:hypothetical protein